MQEFD